MNSNNTEIDIDIFWQWFERNEFKYRSIFDDRNTDLIDDILNKILEIQGGLAVEFEKINGIYKMIVSADGVVDYFDIVQKVVDKSPKIEGWEIIAFRQPYSMETVSKIVMTVGKYKLNPNTIMFYPIIEDDCLYIQIFSEDINEENENQIGYGCLMLLDNIIGEYACVKKVNGYEYYNISEAKKIENDLKPLTKIKEYLDWYYQGKD